MSVKATFLSLGDDRVATIGYQTGNTTGTFTASADGGFGPVATFVIDAGAYAWAANRSGDVLLGAGDRTELTVTRYSPDAGWFQRQVVGQFGLMSGSMGPPFPGPSGEFAVALDPSGNAAVVYGEGFPPATTGWALVQPAGTTTWTRYQLGCGLSHDLRVTFSGNTPVAAWVEGSMPVLQRLGFDGGSAPPQPLSDSTALLSNFSVSGTANGDVLAVWTGGGIWYARWSPDAGLVEHGPAVGAVPLTIARPAVAANGTAWLGWTSGFPGQVGVRLARYDGAGHWATGDLNQTVVDSLAVRLAVDETGAGMAIPSYGGSTNYLAGARLFNSNARSDAGAIVSTVSSDSNTALVACRAGQCVTTYAGINAFGGYVTWCN
jgi:hypothetical protein